VTVSVRSATSRYVHRISRNPLETRVFSCLAFRFVRFRSAAAILGKLIEVKNALDELRDTNQQAEAIDKDRTETLAKLAERLATVADPKFREIKRRYTSTDLSTFVEACQRIGHEIATIKQRAGLELNELGGERQVDADSVFLAGLSTIRESSQHQNRCQ
jgi:hypothetical protein